MDNAICNFKIIHNPNRRYANTVNLVFFKAIPLTKSFKKYVDGLKTWKESMKSYPDSQLQVFVDQAIADDSSIMKILSELNARIILFICPDFLRKDGYHKGLFGTLVRLFPIFDVNTHALRVAHIQELEPTADFIRMFPYLNKVSSITDLDMLYIADLFVQEKLYSEQPEFEFGYFPWVVNGRFMAFNRVPFNLLTDYLRDIEQDKKFFNLYNNSGNSQHGKFTFGIDEQFLNLIYLPWLISNNKRIGILAAYRPSYPVYYSTDKIMKNSKSKDILNYILDTTSSVKASIQEFDAIFYSKGEPSEYKKRCGERFYETIEKYPTWLGTKLTSFVLRFFKGVVHKSFVAIFHGATLKEIRDVR
jgi:hypothetical protein